MPVPDSSSITTVCPSCGAAASGRFCASCGSPLQGAICPSCGSTLSAGARFCHRCGAAVGSLPTPATVKDAARGSAPSVLPWTVAALALVVLIAFVGGQRFAAARGGSLDAPSNALPQAGLDDGGAPPAGADGAVRAPDISQLSPEERASRLFDRVARYSEEGKKDSVMFFAPMALTAYQMLDSLNDDQRYDLGRIGEMSGAPVLARAQADTILRHHPSHLLGLILAASVARDAGQTAASRDYERRLLESEAAERRKGLPEYEQHRIDIDSALARIRRGARG